jgi:hypothetical protein
LVRLKTLYYGRVFLGRVFERIREYEVITKSPHISTSFEGKNTEEINKPSVMHTKVSIQKSHKGEHTKMENNEIALSDAHKGEHTKMENNEIALGDAHKGIWRQCLLFVDTGGKGGIPKKNLYKNWCEYVMVD